MSTQAARRVIVDKLNCLLTSGLRCRRILDTMADPIRRTRTEEVIMATGKDLSLGELEALYRQKIKTLTEERTALANRLGECDDKLKAFEEKLRWVRALAKSPHSAAPLPKPRKKRRQRRSPVRAATLKVLRENPGQWLTASQILAFIRRESRKRVSRQAVNVNLNKLMENRQVQRRRAPAGSGGAHFVYSAV